MPQSSSNSQLHLIQNKLDLTTFESQLLRLATDGDSILFLNDSVYVLLLAEFNSEKFYQLTHRLKILAIDEQMQARNIAGITSNIKAISYSDFVEESQNCKKIISW
jgi:sulfur relay protein TusB/DsrH